MEWNESFLSDVPGWSPFTTVNTSGTCATTKLIQCTDFGVYQCDVTRKFQQDPSEVIDISEIEFLARQKVVEAVMRWSKLIIKEEYIPILYDYEIVKSSAKRVKDRGHLVFTDLTLTRFLLVMCFTETNNTSEPEALKEDYATITKAAANKFMSLLKYVYYREHAPKANFVRATYTTWPNGLHPAFLASLDGPTRDDVPVFHITAENFTPLLMPSEIERIDNLTARHTTKTPRPPGLNQQVMGSRADRPEVDSYAQGNQKSIFLCANCGKAGSAKLPTCTSCKLVRYCDKHCQRTAWPAHRKLCKPIPSANPVA